MDDRDLYNYYGTNFGGVTKQSLTAPATSSDASSSARIPLGSGAPLGFEEHELRDLIWDKGPPIQRVTPVKLGLGGLPLPSSVTASAVPKMADASKLFMEEDELASWLECFPDEAAPDDYMLGAPMGMTSSQSTSAGVSSISTASTSVSPPELGAFQAEQARGSAGASSSSGGSGGTAGLPLKRKVAESYDSDAPNEEFGEKDEMKYPERPPRRVRSAEVHNLSERRRRDKINEKMKALRELIPRCNKRDKASMLDDAIEYTKSLQLQLKMMSMGCNMVPVMYQNLQQSSPASGAEFPVRVDPNVGYAGTPILPFSSVLPGSAAYSGAGFPMQVYHPAAMVFPGQPNGENTNQLNTMPDIVQPRDPNPSSTTNFIESSYLQYFNNHLPQARPSQTLWQARSSQQNQPAKDSTRIVNMDLLKNSHSAEL